MSGPDNPRTLDVLERRLLEAARLERPDARARHRAFLALAGGAMLGSATATSAAAIGTSSAAGTGSLAAASGGAVTPSAAGAAGATAVGGAKILAGATTLVGVAKAVAIGAISGVVVLGAAHKMKEPEPTVPIASTAADVDRRPAPQAAPARPALLAAEPNAPPDRAFDIAPQDFPASERSAPARARAASELVPKPVARAAPSPVAPIEVAPPAAASRPAAQSSLTDEVALLDRARDALVNSDPNRALVILDEYESAKVGTTLSAEAALLRIEALVQRGETARAAALARDFLRAQPRSPVADRMRSIIRAAPR